MTDHALIEPCEHCLDLAEDYNRALHDLDRLREENATLRRQLDHARTAYEQLINGAREGSGDEGSDV